MHSLNFRVAQLWSEYTGEDAGQAAEQDDGGALTPEYLDVYVSAVRDSDPFGFSVQILDKTSESLTQSARISAMLSNII